MWCECVMCEASASLHLANALEIRVTRSLVHTLVQLYRHASFFLPLCPPRRPHSFPKTAFIPPTVPCLDHARSHAVGCQTGKDSFGPRTLATVLRDSGSTATDSPFPGRGCAGAQTGLWWTRPGWHKQTLDVWQAFLAKVSSVSAVSSFRYNHDSCTM